LRRHPWPRRGAHLDWRSRGCPQDRRKARDRDTPNQSPAYSDSTFVAISGFSLAPAGLRSAVGVAVPRIEAQHLDMEIRIKRAVPRALARLGPIGPLARLTEQRLHLGIAADARGDVLAALLGLLIERLVIEVAGGLHLGTLDGVHARNELIRFTQV